MMVRSTYRGRRKPANRPSSSLASARSQHTAACDVLPLIVLWRLSRPIPTTWMRCAHDTRGRPPQRQRCSPTRPLARVRSSRGAGRRLQSSGCTTFLVRTSAIQTPDGEVCVQKKDKNSNHSTDHKTLKTASKKCVVCSTGPYLTGQETIGRLELPARGGYPRRCLGL